MREIITRLVDIEKGGVEVKIFGDVVILEEGEYRLMTSPLCEDGGKKVQVRMGSCAQQTLRQKAPVMLSRLGME